MTRFANIQVSEKWGRVSSGGTFSLVDSAHEAWDGLMFTLCMVDQRPVAVFLDGETLSDSAVEQVIATAPPWAGDVAVVLVPRRSGFDRLKAG